MIFVIYQDSSVKRATKFATPSERAGLSYFSQTGLPSGILVGALVSHMKIGGFSPARSPQIYPAVELVIWDRLELKKGN